MLNYARWAAVSTAEQAKKVSIDVQLEKGAETAKKYGWVETHPPFVVPGESRTKIISLNMAEKEIPALREMLDAASRKEFDVLYVYDLNRFRTLMSQVFDSLCDYGVQIYIGAYPRDPVLPNEYTDEVKSAVGMIVRMADIISRSEINSLQRHYKEKMPKRVSEYGLHAGTGQPPMGYRKLNGNDDVLTIDPVWSKVVLRIKDMYLSGISANIIADIFEREGQPSIRGKRWRHRTIKYILANPFYAGIVTWGRRKTVRDRRKDKLVLVEREPLEKNTGKHTPLWSVDTYHQLLREMQSRKKAYSGVRARQLSRLLYCTCGAVMWASKTSKGEHIWVCSTHERKHSRITDRQALILVARQLVLDIQKMDGLQLPKPEDKRPAIEEKMRDFTARKMRWMNAFETGDLEAKEYSERIASINATLDNLQKELDECEFHNSEVSIRQSQFDKLAGAIETIPNYILNGEPVQVNAELRSFIEMIVIDKTSVKIVIRS